MTFSPRAAELIAMFEGFKSKPYLDIVGVPTIGYGSTFYPDGRKVTMQDQSIDKDLALGMLMSYLNKVALPALLNVKVQLCQGQIDALGCLIYNIGPGAFTKSTLLRKINESASLGDIQSAWALWNKAGGKVIPGLVKRRTEEIKNYKC